MKRKTIEQFLDEAGVTPGPWKKGYGAMDGGYLGIWARNKRDVICRVTPVRLESDTDKINANVISASRDMLVSLIESAMFLDFLSWKRPTVDYDSIYGAIEKALPAYKWPEIKARLEHIEGDINASY